MIKKAAYTLRVHALHAVGSVCIGFLTPSREISCGKKCEKWDPYSGTRNLWNDYYRLPAIIEACFETASIPFYWGSRASRSINKQKAKTKMIIYN